MKDYLGLALLLLAAISNTMHAQQNVGIGTTTPQHRLDVESGGVIAGRFVNTAAATDSKGIYATATGLANQGYGVHGLGNKFGVWGQTSSTALNTGGVRGTAGMPGTTVTGFYGVLGEALNGRGVVGVSNGKEGVLGYSSTLTGVRGEGQTHGVYGLSFGAAGYGVYGESPFIGVWGEGTRTSGNTWGVYGRTYSSGGFGGLFANPNGVAGRFLGNVQVTGSLSKGSGSFKIDHPLDPENKYLYHSFVESPDMMNVYNGNVLLDAQGQAYVELPEWFEALNKDFRYQLTCIGGHAPVFISKKVSGNGFRIAGGSPGLEVSWQITGIRKDAYAEKNRIPVEEVKPSGEKGLYLHPKAFGREESLGIDSKLDAAVLSGLTKN